MFRREQLDAPPGLGQAGGELVPSGTEPPLTGRARWLALGAVLSGSYVSVLNSTVVGVALPSISADLVTPNSRGPEVDWVVTGYLIGIVLAQPLTGWLSDTWGRRITLRTSLLLCCIGAATSASAPSLPVLLAGRVVQGFGAGAVVPISMTTVYALFPPRQRGMAMGVWGVANMAAPAAGPPLGGWLIGLMSWRAVFVVFTTLAALAAVLVHLLVADDGIRRPHRFDLPSWLLAAAGCTTIVVVARGIPSWGLSLPTLISLGATGGVFTWLVRRSLRLDEPLLRFQLFAVPAFSASVVVLCLLSVVQFARHTFVPTQLQVVRDLDPQEVGLLLTPAAIGAAISMPVGGWLTDRMGARRPVLVGLCLCALGMWQLAHLRVDDEELRVVAALVVQGLGTGLVSIPSAISAMNSLPSRFHAHSSSTTALTRQLSGAVGVALLAATLVTTLGAVAPVDADPTVAQAAYNRVFLACFAAILVALAVAWVLVPDADGRSRRTRGQSRGHDETDNLLNHE